MILSLFRSPKKNLVNRINRLFEAQLKIARDGLTSDDRKADRMSFAQALDDMVVIKDGINIFLKDVENAYPKYEIKKARPIFKLAMKNPEKLSEEDKIVLFDGLGLIMNNLSRLTPQMFALKQTGALGFLMGILGAVCFPDVRDKAIELWAYINDCLPLCTKFKINKHVPKSFIAIVIG